MFVVPKNPLTNGTEPRLGWRPCLLRAFIAGKERFKVKALEFLATVHHGDLGQTAMAAHTLPQNHHAGTVTGGIEGKHDGQQAARESVGQQCEPGTTKVAICVGTEEFHVQFGVIDMANVKRTLSMTRRGEFRSV